MTGVCHRTFWPNLPAFSGKKLEKTPKKPRKTRKNTENWPESYGEKVLGLLAGFWAAGLSILGQLLI